MNGRKSDLTELILLY